MMQLKIKQLRKFKRFLALYILMLPGLIYVLINNYAPMGGLIIAFKKIDFRKGLLGSDWVGFSNFEYLFKTKDAFIITRNTILYNVAFIIINTLGAIFLAILLNEIKNKGLKSFYQSVILLPYLMSMVVVSYLVFAILSSDNGFLNNSLLAALGIDPINWYTAPKYWPFILVFVNLWKGIGFGTVIYLSAILGIDQEYYESANLDGATIWQQITHITIPLIKPTIFMLVLLSIGRIFYSDFGLFYQVPMNSGTLFPVTNVIDTYVYRGLMVSGNISMSAAAGFYQSMVGFILVLLSNAIVRKVSREDALF